MFWKTKNPDSMHKIDLLCDLELKPHFGMNYNGDTKAHFDSEILR